MEAQSVFSHWHFSAGLLGFLLLLYFIYLYITGFRTTKRTAYFTAALLIIILCAASPLHFIGGHYLFSAHMTSHILLLLIAGPMLTAAIPEENKFSRKLKAFSQKLQRFPFISWLTGIGIMWLWHIPVLFNSLLKGNNMAFHHHGSQTLMDIHMLSLLISGMLFCWPVMGPYQHFRIKPLTGVLYLASACVFCSLLGLIITFSPAGTYTHYTEAGGDSAFLSVIRHRWNISAENDQQAGGLIMWVPCCFVYLSASMVLLIRWLEDRKAAYSIYENR